MDKYFCTLLVPTNRPAHFLNLCNSLELTSDHDINPIRVVAIVDDDSVTSAIEYGLSKANFRIDIQFLKFSNPYGQYGVFIGINKAISRYKSEWFQITSDDILYTYDKWNISLGEIEIPKHGICRIKSSVSRNSSIRSATDAITSPDCFPYISAKYISLLNTCGDCYGSDTFFEGISYYLHRINKSQNPFRKISLNIDITLTEPYYTQPDFGLDLEISHQQASTFIMYLEWVRLLSNSYQSFLINQALIIANQILTEEGFFLVGKGNRFLKYSKLNQVYIIRRKQLISEKYLNFYSKLTIIYLILINIIAIYDFNNRLSKKLRNFEKIYINIKKFIKKILIFILHFMQLIIEFITSKLHLKLGILASIKNYLKKLSPKRVHLDEVKFDLQDCPHSPPVGFFLSNTIFGSFLVGVFSKKIQYLRRFSQE